MFCILIKRIILVMSRIGKLPVSLPDKVSVELLPGNVVKVKGPLGELSSES
jgi:large subunit ribosomal protein L6